MFPPQLETDRLRLERLGHDTVDVDEYYDLWATADPAVYEHLSATPFSTVKEAKDEIDAAEAYWADDDTATYLIRPKEGEPNAGDLTGRTSLDCSWERRIGDLGIMLAKPFWGRGYSGERAGALRRWCRSLLTPCTAGFLFFSDGRIRDDTAQISARISGPFIRTAVTEIRRVRP